MTELKPCPHCIRGSVSGDPEGAPIEDCLRCDGTGLLASLPARLRKSARGDRPLLYEAAAEIERLTAELDRRPSAGAEPEVVEAAARAVCATRCRVKKLPYDCNCVCWHKHADDAKTVLALLSVPRSVKDLGGRVEERKG